MQKLLLNLTYGLDDINNNCFVSGGDLASFLGHQGPQFVQVDGRFEVLVSLEMEVALALLTEVPRMAEQEVSQKRVFTISQS